MGLRLADRWIWDFWLARDGADHHLFYLQAPRSLGDPERRHWHVSIGHAVSTDLRTWTVLPDALAPAPAGAWDDYTTWTGSIVRHDERWWMFYTGTGRRENGKVQRIGLATSEDLLTWRRHGDTAVVEADPRWYEQLDPAAWPELAWRDPWVFPDPDGDLFHMMITARSRDGAPATRGVIGHATSPDLLTWTVEPPVTASGAFGHLEIPQVLWLNGAWRLLFSAPPAPAPVSVNGMQPGSSTVEGTHLLSADRPCGPYHWSTHQILDADRTGTRYGGRLVSHEDDWYLLTWLGAGPDRRFVGELADPMPIRVPPPRR